MALYETVFIARQDLNAEDVDALANKFCNIINDFKGKVVSKEYWGLRNLAVKVNKNNRGHYILINVNANFPAIAELKRVMGYTEEVIRSVIYKVESHQEESPLFVSPTAKDFKPSITSKKQPGKFDLILEQFQFDS
jgi:small subunit ribosomal protein S6